MRKVAFVLAFLICTSAGIVEAPYTPIWDAPKHETLIKLQTAVIKMKREKAREGATVTFLRFHDVLVEAEKAGGKKRQELLAYADLLQHLGYRQYLNGLLDRGERTFYLKYLYARDI
jgi:hypothetical protein